MFDVWAGEKQQLLEGSLIHDCSHTTIVNKIYSTLSVVLFTFLIFSMLTELDRNSYKSRGIVIFRDCATLDYINTCLK